jgi:hypothetical protein
MERLATVTTGPTSLLEGKMDSFVDLQHDDWGLGVFVVGRP